MEKILRQQYFRFIKLTSIKKPLETLNRYHKNTKFNIKIETENFIFSCPTDT